MSVPGSAEAGASTPVALEVKARAAAPHDEDRALTVLGQFREELRTHHQVQSELATLMRDLAAPMRALPELARQQSGLMETLVDQSSRHRTRDQVIERSLVQLTEGANRQTQVLGLVQQQLDLNHETSVRVADSLRDTASALSAFAATTDRQTRALEALAESTRRRLAQSERLERSLQFWLLVVAGLATIILLYALWAALRVPSTAVPAPATPAVQPAASGPVASANPAPASAGTSATASAPAPAAPPAAAGPPAGTDASKPSQPAAPRTPAAAAASASPASTIP